MQPVVIGSLAILALLAIGVLGVPVWLSMSVVALLGMWLVGQEKPEVLTVIKDHLASNAEGDFMDKWMGLDAK